MTAYFVKPNAPPQAAWESPTVKSTLEDLTKSLQAIREIDLAGLAYEELQELLAYVRDRIAEVMQLVNSYVSIQMELEATCVSSALNNAANS